MRVLGTETWKFGDVNTGDLEEFREKLPRRVRRKEGLWG